MKLLNFDRALCLSPHPDDVEYSMSGTMMKYPNTFFDVLTLSIGGKYDSTTTEDRHNEVNAAWKKACIRNISITNREDLKPKDCPQDLLIHKIESEYLKDHHDVLFVPTHLDSHFEHRIVNSLAYALTRVKNTSIIEYRTPSTLNEWSPNMYINITDHYYRKVGMLSEFQSQKSKWYFDQKLIENFHKDYQSYKKGYEYVEQYKVNQLYRI